MFEYFILLMVALIIGGAIFGLGSSVKKGINSGTKKVDEINARLDA